MAGSIISVESGVTVLFVLLYRAAVALLGMIHRDAYRAAAAIGTLSRVCGSWGAAAVWPGRCPPATCASHTLRSTHDRHRDTNSSTSSSIPGHQNVSASVRDIFSGRTCSSFSESKCPSWTSSRRISPRGGTSSACAPRPLLSARTYSRPMSLSKKSSLACPARSELIKGTSSGSAGYAASHLRVSGSKPIAPGVLRANACVRRTGKNDPRSSTSGFAAPFGPVWGRKSAAGVGDGGLWNSARFRP